MDENNIHLHKKLTSAEPGTRQQEHKPLSPSLSSNSSTSQRGSHSLSLVLALFCRCRQLGTAETSNLLLGDRARPEQACGVAEEGEEEEGELAPASASDPARALLGCTQSQPNKKPFIGRVQLSQTGWEHVAFKNEEGGMREWGWLREVAQGREWRAGAPK